MKTKHTSIRKSVAAMLTSLALLCAHAACAQYMTLSASGQTKPSSQTVNVASNQLATVLHARASGGGASLEIVSGGVTNIYGSSDLPIIAGPATIRATALSGITVNFFCTLEITQPASSFVPINTVVIPNDNGAPVQVVLESSVDMVTWVPASPGTYGSSAANRFFRVRAQR